MPLSILNSLCRLLCLAVLLLNACGRTEAPRNPHWPDKVIYFLMVDRFANGDPSNDRQTKSGIESGPKESQYSGGDLQGLLQHLEYIKGMGVDAIWITPPVANQWWDGTVDYGGYHGYWARHFRKVDEHLGDLALYKKLVQAAHRKGLLVIQDIVCNHTANYILYRKGQYTLNSNSHPPLRPDQYPFSQNDFTDPEQRKAGIYHFPGTVTKPDRFNTAFANLDDLNTENPKVVSALKQSYAFWIRECGVDAFRVDTAIYVPDQFWRDFLLADNGILAQARSCGKTNFLVFGEAWFTPRVLTNDGERNIAPYFQVGFNGMLDFPLMTGITRVFKEGRPTKLLAYRLEQRAIRYPHQARLVTFIDNHDMSRFLNGGTKTDLKLALAFLFSVPGIPCIYYGTEQGFQETRAAMFAGGFASGGVNSYNRSHPLYTLIADLVRLRRRIPAFRYGKVIPCFSQQDGPGILAYELRLAKKRWLVICNTAVTPKYLSGLDLGLDQGTVLDKIFGINTRTGRLVYGTSLDCVIAPKSFVVLSIGRQRMQIERKVAVTIDNLEPNQVLSDKLGSTFTVSGWAKNAHNVRLILNGTATPLAATSLNGKKREPWSLAVKFGDLNPGPHRLLAVASNSSQRTLGYSRTYRVQLEVTAEVLGQANDVRGDDHGPNGRYRYPKDKSFGRQMDILGAEAIKIGGILRLKLRMAELSNIWQPPNGFDHVTFQIFFNNPLQKGKLAMPKQDYTVPPGSDWEYQVWATGWNLHAFSAQGAARDRFGSPLTPAPRASIVREQNTVVLDIPLSIFGTTDLSGWELYITTFDYDGLSGRFRSITRKGGRWAFGGGNPGDPKIMDDMLLRLRR